MTPREIDALVAEKLFNWKWWTNTARRMRILVGPEPEWVRWNWNPSVMVPWNGDQDIILFSDWDRACGVRDPQDSLRLAYEGLPHYSADPTASKQLRDKMREKGWSWSMIREQNVISVEFWPFGDIGNFTERRADTEEMAVALAALATCGVDIS